MDRPSVAEQYLRSTNSSNLKVMDTPCDADKLLAAAYTQSGDPEKRLALILWRMRATGRTYDFRQVVDIFDAKVHQKLARRNKRIGKTRTTVEQAIWWWLNPVCRVCEGRGRPIIDGTPVLNALKECDACKGTGQSDWRKLIMPEQHHIAEMVIDGLERHSSLVFADMARLLKKDLE